MIRRNLFPLALMLFGTAGFAAAQDQLPAPPQQQTPANPGGWRRVNTPPTPTMQGNPEPVDRSDAYGQPMQNAPMQNAPAPPPQDPQGPPRANDRQMYGPPPELSLKAGTYVTIRTNQPLSSDHNQPGDTFSATLVQPVVIDGIVVADRGQTVYGRVAEVEKQHSDKNSRLGLELTGITLVDGTQTPVRSQLVARQGTTTPTGAQVGTVAGTTALGAAVGAAADWGRGAAIGAGVGAAAGIIGVLATRNHPTIVYPETALTFQVTYPVTISTARAPQAFRYVGPEDYNRPVETQLQHRPVPGPGYPYGPGYYPAYPYPNYGGYYYGPGVGFVFGPGYFYGRGYYRRWR